MRASLVFLGIALAAVVVVGWVGLTYDPAHFAGWAPRDGFQLGPLDPGSVYGWGIAVAVVAAAIGLGFAAGHAGRRRSWVVTALLSVGTVALVIVGGLFWAVNAFLSLSTSTALTGDTGSRQLVAVEDGRSGRLYERDGLVLHYLGELDVGVGTWDAYSPFRHGDYRVSSVGGADAAAGRVVVVAWPSTDTGDLRQQLVIDDAAIARGAAGEVLSEECHGPDTPGPATDRNDRPIPNCLEAG